VFAGRRITVRVPKLFLGDDDGFLNASAIVGTARRPTDIVPETGHLTLGDPGQPVSVRGALVRRVPVRGDLWR
jgi:hypothetical protein